MHIDLSGCWKQTDKFFSGKGRKYYHQEQLFNNYTLSQTSYAGLLKEEQEKLFPKRAIR